MDILQSAADLLPIIKNKQPLIHQITNYVTLNDCANVTLAIGASPVMASYYQEVTDMVAHAAALVLNLGTPDANRIKSMLLAGERANELGIPVIFDPVGVGATEFRKQAAQSLLQSVRVAVVRGNMSEIKQLAGIAPDSRGVDSTADATNGEQVALDVAARFNSIVAITGQTDIIADRDSVYRIDNGHPLLAGVTGTGCMATALIGAFCAAANNYLAAAAGGILMMGIAGELAARSLKPGEGLGTFRVRLIDTLSLISAEQLLKFGQIRSISIERRNL